jgi:hypothetical protein
MNWSTRSSSGFSQIVRKCFPLTFTLPTVAFEAPHRQPSTLLLSALTSPKSGKAIWL